MIYNTINTILQISVYTGYLLQYIQHLPISMYTGYLLQYIQYLP